MGSWRINRTMCPNNVFYINDIYIYNLNFIFILLHNTLFLFTHIWCVVYLSVSQVCTMFLTLFLPHWLGYHWWHTYLMLPAVNNLLKEFSLTHLGILPPCGSWWWNCRTRTVTTTDKPTIIMVLAKYWAAHSQNKQGNNIYA